jgi:uncharacterized protein involved in outer membrane biogenesis
MFNRTPNNNIPPFPENGLQIQDQEPEPKITPFGLIRKLFLTALLFLLSLYLISSLSAPLLKITVQDYLEKQLNTNIKIGNIGINLLTRSLTLENLEIKNPKGFGDKMFLETESVSIRPALIPLFSKKLVISRIAIENPLLNLCTAGKNQNNWSFLFDNKKSEDNKNKFLLPVKEFLIKNGTIKYKQNIGTKEKAEIELDGIFIYIKSQKHPIEYIKDTPLNTSIKGRGYLPTKPKGTLSFEGNINTIEKQPSFLGKIHMNNISLTYFNKFYPDNATIEVLSGSFSLETKTGCLQGRINAKPDVIVKGLQLKLTSDYSTSDIFKLPLMLVIDFFDIYKEELKFSFNVSGTLKDPQFHLEEILKQEISTMISESIMNAITTTPSIAEKLKSLGNNIVEAGKSTGKIVTKPVDAFVDSLKDKK